MTAFQSFLGILKHNYLIRKLTLNNGKLNIEKLTRQSKTDIIKWKIYMDNWKLTLDNENRHMTINSWIFEEQQWTINNVKLTIYQGKKTTDNRKKKLQ